MKQMPTYKIVITALFAALICVATILIQIPIPATGGYANLGDGSILICAYMMTPVYAMTAAGLGSALADILAGYVSYAPATLVIKAGVALIAAFIFSKIGKDKNSRSTLAVMIAAGVLAEGFMVLGYFFYEAVILGYGLSAAGAVIGNIGQGAVGIIVGCIVAPVLLKSPDVTELINRM